jgi:hypothetical protein
MPIYRPTMANVVMGGTGVNAPDRWPGDLAETGTKANECEIMDCRMFDSN